MTDTKRWSDPSSDVDPVLRSVVRYGSELGPDSKQLQRLLRATDTGVAATARRPPRGSRRFTIALAAGLAAAFSGAAWARFAGHWGAPGVSAPAPTMPRASSSAAPARLLPSQPVQSAPAVVGAAPTPAPRPASAPVSASAGPRASASAEDDAALLQHARAAVASNPARALALTRDHELRFSSSPLAEERQALRVEALFRLGRRQEAAREREAFEAVYPRSPYRRRLQALER